MSLPDQSYISYPVGLHVLEWDGSVIMLFEDSHERKAFCPQPIWARSRTFTNWLKRTGERVPLWFGLEDVDEEKSHFILDEPRYRSHYKQAKRSKSQQVFPIDLVRIRLHPCLTKMQNGCKEFPNISMHSLDLRLKHQDFSGLLQFRKCTNANAVNKHLRILLHKILYGKIKWFPELTQLYQQLSKHDKQRYIQYIKAHDFYTKNEDWDFTKQEKSDSDFIGMLLIPVFDWYTFLSLLSDRAYRLYVLYTGFIHTQNITKMFLELEHARYVFGVRSRGNQCIQLSKTDMRKINQLLK